ncbi:hypothetical protein CHLNCDRAFT_139459 [Chlorella variabilis]|uniref:Uncharacterized protein n=1 Tax=Chlorella variabilis TaxID=554065 RepID=E1ZQ69_CHLVA|nr:hypothetical protein CHLNCDRAFT_139459 [Chlorella variabilis]EFN51967.1 hypothetical protein CHLNCDRAFT_139459 [Chlorella variabilis]|eukprot:XP_005844069.1 hypothetical protein CHLNCDRAFT_139459 [Chlorella variabilis]
MVRKRAAKNQRAGEETAERPAAPPSPVDGTAEQVTEAEALAAVEARRQSILQHAATVTPALLLAWLTEDLGMPHAAVKVHRSAVTRRALEVLEEQGQLPDAGVGPAGAPDLPPDCLPAVFRHLDHDTLFCALQACKAWRAVGSAADAQGLWEQQCKLRGWGQPGGAGAAAGAAQQQQQQQQQQQGQQQQPGIDWRNWYRQQYQRSCFDCFQPTERHTLGAGTLRVRLCRACSAAYVTPRPHHRLLSASAAKRKCCLRDADLAPLPRCVDPNPVDPAFQPMHLYRRLDARRAAVDRWGSWEAAEAEHRRRLTR